MNNFTFLMNLKFFCFNYSPTCNKPHHYHKQNSNEPIPLTTITEESPSWKSSSSSMSTGPDCGAQTSTKNFKNHMSELQSIVVQPEVIVETTQNADDTNTTKVTSTIKVELLTPARISRSYSISSST